MSSFELTNAVAVTPYKCELCTSNQPPFINTKIPRPSGGSYHVCSTCWRQFLIVLEAVGRDEHEAVREHVRSANEQLAGLQAERIDVDVITAELTNVRAELAMAVAEVGTLKNEVGRLERDNADLRDGHQMTRSEAPAAAAAIVAETLAEIEENANEQPPKKPATARKAA